MNNFSAFQTIFKQLITENALLLLLAKHQYSDTARKFSVSHLLDFFAASSLRHGCDILGNVNFSTVSKKAACVPFGIFKDLFAMILSRCNHNIKRGLKFPKPLLAIDSTTIMFGENRLSWAAFHGKRSELKLHVAFDQVCSLPIHVQESTARLHDSMMLKRLNNKRYIRVVDRAYFKIAYCDQCTNEGQQFDEL